MDLESQLVHAEPGKRVVQVLAKRDGQLLGSALGEGATAEEAEDRAIQRLEGRLQQPSPTLIVRPEPTTTPELRDAGAEAEPVAQGKPMAEAMPVADAKAIAEPLLPTLAGPANPASPANPGHGAAPDHDPEDWSSELARLDLQLQRLGWSRDQEGLYLERAFGHPSRNRLTQYGDLVAYLTALESLAPGTDPSTASVPLRRRDLLGQCDQLLGQLQWDASTGRAFLEQHFALTSRQQLSDSQLLQFNMLLEGALMGL